MNIRNMSQNLSLKMKDANGSPVEGVLVPHVIQKAVEYAASDRVSAEFNRAARLIKQPGDDTWAQRVAAADPSHVNFAALRLAGYMRKVAQSPKMLQVLELMLGEMAGMDVSLEGIPTEDAVVASREKAEAAQRTQVAERAVAEEATPNGAPHQPQVVTNY